jgi:predicted DNA-binding transcriptional regulator AlpA
LVLFGTIPPLGFFFYDFDNMTWPPNVIQSQGVHNEMNLASFKKTAAYLGISTQTLQRGVKAGKYPLPLKVGIKKLAWDLDEVAEQLKAQRGTSSCQK